MNLGRIEDDIAEDRHHLLEPGCFLYQVFREVTHLTPELDARHTEIALQAFLQVCIQADILLRR